MPSAWRIAEINEKEITGSGIATLAPIRQTAKENCFSAIENYRKDINVKLVEAIIQARLELKEKKKREIKGGRAEILNQTIKQLKLRLCYLRSYQSKLNRIDDLSVESQQFFVKKVNQYLSRI